MRIISRIVNTPAAAAAWGAVASARLGMNISLHNDGFTASQGQVRLAGEVGWGASGGAEGEALAEAGIVYGSTKGFVSYGGFTHVGFHSIGHTQC